MKPCLKLILAQPDPVQETFAQRVERGLSLGATQEEAKREAARMLMDDIKAEAEMIEKALREQHPEVFEGAAGGPAKPGIRYSIEPGYSAEADPETVRWLSAQGGNPGEVGVIYDKPIEALRMAAEAKGITGFTKFTGISRIAARHAMRDHPEITPEVLASAFASLRSPRLIVDGGRKEDGRHAMVLVTPVNVGPGEGLPVLVAINSGKRGTDFASVALVATSYGKENSAAWVAAQIKAGKVVYADEAELGRLARYQRALKLPSIQRMPGGKTTQVPAFSVLTSANLGKFTAGQKGWNKSVIIEPARDAADIGVGAKFSRDSLGFYSELEAQIEKSGPGKADPGSWGQFIGALSSKGVKADEVEWSGVTDWLDMQQGKVSKQQVLEYLNAGGVRVEEVTLGQPRRNATKYGQYTLPGGENYREVLLTLPEAKGKTQSYYIAYKDGPTLGSGFDSEAAARAALAETFEGRNDLEIRPGVGERASIRTGYKSAHWDEPNVLAHIRLNDRTDADGNKVLFVEEAQSDWGQSFKKQRDAEGSMDERIDAILREFGGPIGRTDGEGWHYRWMGEKVAAPGATGYGEARAQQRAKAESMARERVGKSSTPAAPFVTKTDGWLNLALKRVMAMAVDGGYDKIAFVTGEQSAERYDLSKQVDMLSMDPGYPGGYNITAWKGGDEVASKKVADEAEAAEMVGKEVAARLFARKDEGHVELTGLDLKVGGEGMKYFYDAIVPNAVKALAKKVGGVVGPVRVQVGETTRRLDPPMMGRRAEPVMADQPGLTITDAMRAKVEAGLPRFSRDEGQFELPEFGPGSRAQLALQDRYNRWKQAVQAVREQGGNVNEYNDFYLAEERYWGRVGAQNEAFGQEVEDFVEAVKKDGLTLQDVAEYVYAKHAAERNAYVAKMRDDMEGTGSGMTDEEADSILIAAEQSGLEPLLMKHAEKLYEWIDGTRQVMLENGLISEAEANSWEGMFTHYVPLRGLEGKEPQGKGTGAGFNIKGKESKQITGRRSKAKQIIEQIVQDRTKAYIRAGKNEVLRTFLNFALENPSPNLWKVNAVETKPTVVVDEFGNRTVEQREMLVSDPRRVVSLKDGGQTIHIEVKDQELLKQLQNGYATTPVAPVAAMLWANRTLGAMLTAFSPVFVAMNAVRDAQTAFFGMIGVKGYKGAGNLALQYPAALREAFKAHFGEPSAEYREYLLAGGTTGYFGLKELDETGEELAVLMRNAERSPVNPIKAGKALAKFVENVNGVIEQTTRFAAYRAAKRSGSTVAESASISKNLTVNFNRKGSLANFTGAAVLFFNPAVQGTARLAQAMKSPKVWGALGGASAGVFFLALANADMGGEDDDGVSFWDKVPREVKERNLVIMRPPVRKEDGTLESRYIKIPVAYGYNVFLVAAYEMADAIRHRDDKTKGREPMESAARVATAFLGATLPVQALGQSLEDSSTLGMAPYSNATGPIFQALMNVNSFGRPLYPESPNTKYLPDSQKYSVGQAGTIFQKAAEKLNEAAGGDKFTSSGRFTDIAPGSLENAARFYGGGLTSMALDIMNAFYVRQHIERPEPDLKRLPFAKQFYGSINDETDRWFAYDRMNKAEKQIQPLEAAIRAGDAQAVETILKREPLAVAGDALNQVRQTLADIRKAELAIIQDPDLKDGERYVRLMEQSKNAREVLRQWNAVYDDLNKREEPAR